MHRTTIVGREPVVADNLSRHPAAQQDAEAMTACLHWMACASHGMTVALALDV